MFLSHFRLGVLLLSLIPFQAPRELPAGWLGEWKGALTIQSSSNTQITKVPFELTIRQLSDAKGYQWTLAYKPVGKSDIRQYVLYPDKQKPGLWTLDEKNGIKLSLQQFGDLLVGQFKVGDSLLAVKYELRDKQIAYEIVAHNARPATTGGGNVPEVEVFPVLSIQRAVLVRSAK